MMFVVLRNEMDFFRLRLPILEIQSSGGKQWRCSLTTNDGARLGR
ncbi:hypothetical protein L843_4246 [Mycobacterium intracellulare MIN_061107_1834]|nr:hypothetical protein L843_4246 [Mycobacterium intracellulare MIN_061107_1834]